MALAGAIGRPRRRRRTDPAQPASDSHTMGGKAGPRRRRARQGLVRPRRARSSAFGHAGQRDQGKRAALGRRVRWDETGPKGRGCRADGEFRKTKRCRQKPNQEQQHPCRKQRTSPGGNHLWSTYKFYGLFLRFGKLPTTGRVRQPLLLGGRGHGPSKPKRRAATPKWAKHPCGGGRRPRLFTEGGGFGRRTSTTDIGRRPPGSCFAKRKRSQLYHHSASKRRCCRRVVGGDRTGGDRRRPRRVPAPGGRWRQQDPVRIDPAGRVAPGATCSPANTKAETPGGEGTRLMSDGPGPGR